MLAFHDHSRRLPHRRRPQPPFSIIQQALSSSASNTTIHRRSNTPNPPTIEGTSNPSPPVYIQSISEHHELPRHHLRQRAEHRPSSSRRRCPIRADGGDTDSDCDDSGPVIEAAKDEGMGDSSLVGSQREVTIEEKTETRWVSAKEEGAGPLPTAETGDPNMSNSLDHPQIMVMAGEESELLIGMKNEGWTIRLSFAT